MAKQTFKEFKKDFEERLLKDYLITINDCTDNEQLKREYKDGTSAQDFVDFIGEKHHLDKIDS